MEKQSRNIKLVIEYDGTAYHGWQFQENVVSVQEKVEEAIFSLTGEKTRVTAAGRTDAGVHAHGQVINFETDSKLPIHNIEMGTNAHLPGDIVVRAATEVPADFNARFSAKKRVYHYTISTERTALHRDFCWQFFSKFDPDLLKFCAEAIIGEHDFGAFSRVEVQASHKGCTVYESEWKNDGAIWRYRISANRFLHGMVRTIVGTIMDVARGHLSFDEFIQIFEARDRTMAGPAAPARGLVLYEVEY